MHLCAREWRSPQYIGKWIVAYRSRILQAGDQISQHTRERARRAQQCPSGAGLVEGLIDYFVLTLSLFFLGGTWKCQIGGARPRSQFVRFRGFHKRRKSIPTPESLYLRCHGRKSYDGLSLLTQRPVISALSPRFIFSFLALPRCNTPPVRRIPIVGAKRASGSPPGNSAISIQTTRRSSSALRRCGTPSAYRTWASLPSGHSAANKTLVVTHTF